MREAQAPAAASTPRELVRQLAATLVGPVVAFAATLVRIVVGPDIDDTVVVSALLGAVVAGAAFGGRWAALATVALATVGLLLTLAARLGVQAAVPVVLAVAVALVTGELRDRADREEHEAGVARARLRRLALRDPLTGLLDRRGFDFAIGVELARESRRAGTFALLLLTVRDVGAATERFGRSVADTLLQIFADSLEARIRQSDIAAHVGDNEFAVILADADAAGAERVARQVISTFRENLRGVVPAELDVQGDFGVALFPIDGTTGDALFARASAQKTPASDR